MPCSVSPISIFMTTKDINHE